MTGLEILVIPGSARSGSLNVKLARCAARQAAALSARATELDLRSLELPLYDADLERASGMPAGALRLRDAIAASDALLLVTPEYNGFPPPLLINAFDWLSRIPAVAAAPAGLAATAGRPAALLAASPGAGGALRSMNFLRQYLQMSFAMIVVPQQFALGAAHQAFDADGALADAKALRSVDTVLQSLVALAGALRAARAAA